MVDEYAIALDILLTDGTKPLSEPMLTNDQGGVVAFTW